MDKIKFEEAQAKMWISDVKNEIDIVEGILKKTNECLTSVPGDDDTVYQGIRKIGATLTSVWGKMVGGFREASDLVKSSIEKWSNAGNELSQQGEDLNRKLGG